MKENFAKVSLKANGDQSWLAQILCINGDPSLSSDGHLPNGTTYFDGSPIPQVSEVIAVLSDDFTIDKSRVFPWAKPGSDANSQKGGIGKGKVVEVEQGAADKESSPTGETQTMIASDWINGAVSAHLFHLEESMLEFLQPNQELLFYFEAIGPEKPIVRSFSILQGNCLDLLI